MMHAGMAGHMFAAADANKDGRVSLQEATAAAAAHFDRLDTNHDGVVTPDEMRAAHAAMRGPGGRR
jgi:Ca2+-binding EF-hand superfamily protein